MDFTYSLTDNESEKYQKLLMDTVYDNAIDATNKDAVDSALNYVETQIIKEKYSDFMKLAVAKAVEENNTKWMNKYDPSSSRGQRQVVANGTSTKEDYGTANINKYLFGK
jgi:hypothetical protein